MRLCRGMCTPALAGVCVPAWTWAGYVSQHALGRGYVARGAGGRCTPPRTDHKEVGMHPTGRHSCCFVMWLISVTCFSGRSYQLLQSDADSGSVESNPEIPASIINPPLGAMGGGQVPPGGQITPDLLDPDLTQKDFTDPGEHNINGMWTIKWSLKNPFRFVKFNKWIVYFFSYHHHFATLCTVIAMPSKLCLSYREKGVKASDRVVCPQVVTLPFLSSLLDQEAKAILVSCP